MSQFPDIMVDIETTGTDPSRTAMIQLAAVRFNIREGTIDTSSFFKRSLAIPFGRFWDEGTRGWWNRMPTLRDEILNAAEPPAKVMNDFQQWVVKGFSANEPYRFWAKPQSFDWPFVASYFQQFEVHNPFDFREAIDMRSYLRMALGTWDLREVVAFEKSIPFQGKEHDGLYDALHQIAVVLAARERVKAKVAS